MKTKNGSGLVFAVILLFVILAMVVTLSSITILETKMGQKTKSSVGAFYKADSGVEWALNKIATTSGDLAIGNTGAFNDTNIADGVACPAEFGCNIYFLDENGKVITDGISKKISDIKAVRSVGTQGGETQRAIEAAVASGNSASFTFHCFNDAKFNAGYGTPHCTDAGGSQGFCPNGFKQEYFLGTWSVGYFGSSLYSYCPPLTNCTYGGYVPDVMGNAYVCSKI